MAADQTPAEGFLPHDRTATPAIMRAVQPVASAITGFLAKTADIGPIARVGLLAVAILIADGGIAAGSGHAGGLSLMAALFLASVASSIAGFAFSAIAGAMVFHLSADHVHLVEIMLLCSIANQALMVWSLRRSIALTALGPFVAGAAVGVPLGVLALLHLDHLSYTRVLGVLLLAYGGYMMFRKPFTVSLTGWRWDVLIGIAGGITGGGAATPGAPVAIWCGAKGWDKTRQRAVFQPFILIAQIGALATIPLLAPSGGHGWSLHPSDLLFIPATMIGTRCGLALFHRMNDRQFARAMNALLMVSGLSFVI
jgi:uncharacterized membrane protein YfcA